jgi:hypothetical protein
VSENTEVRDSACTGVAETCPIDECFTCAERDCPQGEPLHYHHDGCPACAIGVASPARRAGVCHDPYCNGDHPYCTATEEGAER